MSDTEVQQSGVLPRVEEFLSKTRGMLIDGEEVAAMSGRTFATLNPGTGERLADVAEAWNEDVDRAVRSAKAAFEGSWSQVTPSDRGRLLLRLADLVEENGDELAQLESLDGGLPITDVLGEIPLIADQLRYFGGWATKIEGSTIVPSVPGSSVRIRRQPVGVIAAIVPWNFPLDIATWKLGPALAAGCTAVIKPAEQTPLSTLRLGELIMEAGFPPGVVNICPGFGELAGAALVDHPDVGLVAFTGSVAVGKEIARRAARTLKPVALELGGKSPSIVLSDIDIASAASGLSSAIFFHAGQVCSAGSRLLVDRRIYDDVVSALVEEAQALRMGMPLDPETTLGPLVSAEQRERVWAYVESGVAEGASLRCGGDVPADMPGYFVEPTIFVDAPAGSRIKNEEIFGPVLVAEAFDNVEEAISVANGTDYGLAAGVWTNDLRDAETFAARIDAGTVWINSHNLFDAAVPFQGWKRSGYGADGGREALDKFLRSKAIWTTSS